MISSRLFRYTFAIAAAVALMAIVVPAVSAGGGGDTPGNLRVGPPDSSVGGCLKLTWWVEDPSGVAAYRVYRSRRPDSGFAVVFEGEVNADRPSRIDHVDTGLQKGATYYYKVALVGADGRETGETGVEKGTAPGATAASSSGGGPFKSIVISINDQTIYFLEDDVLVKSHLCSTGTDAHPTPTGVFKVLYHEYLMVTDKYGVAYCYWWMGFSPDPDVGMHALPYDPATGTWTGANSLGHKASHGCVRQTLADAEWAYKWAPDGTRIDCIPQHYEPPPPPPPPITGGHASRGVSDASTTWYLAEGCTGENFDEYVLVMNPAPDTADVDAEFMRSDGTVVRRSYQVPGLSRYTVHVNEITGLESADVSTKLTSSIPVVAERSMYFDYNGKLGGSCSSGVPAPAEEWYLAEGYTGDDFDEYVLVQNPGDQDVTANFRFMLSGGQNITKAYPVGAHSRFSLHVDEVPGLSGAEVSTKITCSRPIIAERAQYFSYHGKDDGNASSGVTEPSRTWYLAEGYTGEDFDEYVLIQNPGEEAGTVTATYMCGDGTNVVERYDMNPRSRFSVHVDDIPGLESKDVSTVVEADVDVIAERSMYFSTYGRKGGSDAPGVPSPHEHWYLAEGYTGGYFDSYVLILNPFDDPVSVDVGFLLPAGSMKTFTYTVAPHSRYTIHVDDVAGMSDTEFSTSLRGEKPIICERAVYFSIPRN